MMLLELADIARRTGYPVVEVPGWKTRGRPGGMKAVQTITCHHTANGGAKGNYPSLRVVRDGRSKLPGPLAQLGLGIDGTIYVIAAGKCNHAGESRALRYSNSYAIGIEAEAVGTPGAKGDWPAQQMDAYVRLCRALVDHYRLSSDDVRGHRETCSPTGRKSDPTFDMSALRARIRTLSPVRKAEPAVAPEPIKLDPATIKAIAAAVAQQTIYDEDPDVPGRKITTIGGALTDIDVTAEANHAKVLGKLGELVDAVKALTVAIKPQA